MTVQLSGSEVAKKITEKFPGAVVEANDQALMLNSESLLKVAEHLKTSPEFAFNYLVDITAVDYFEYFEVVYRLLSLEHNHALVLKTRCYGREGLTLPSVLSLWRSADYMEREIYDLMGIKFEGRSDMRRIFMWEGFKGHPLRKDFLG